MEKKEGIGALTLLCVGLTIAFVVLRLCKVIAWEWVWVISPIWIPLAIWAAIVIIITISTIILDKMKE